MLIAHEEEAYIGANIVDDPMIKDEQATMSNMIVAEMVLRK